MPEKQHLSASHGKVEQACDNCKHCREDVFAPGIYICSNNNQIFTVVKPEDYCFYHEREKES